MIQPIGALTPKVFRGSVDSESVQRTKRRIALLNAGGVSAMAGAVTTVLTRNVTSSWAHAGALGFLAGGATMMILAPNFLYKKGNKNGVKTTTKESSPLIKTLESRKNIVGNYARTMLKRTA